MRRVLLAASIALGLIAQLAPVSAGPGAATLTVAGASKARSSGPGDATVIAVIDNAFTPYHWDYLASKMPQANDKDRANDLPLDTAPDRWLPGFPAPSSFDDYSSLDLTLDDKNANTPIAGLDAKDTKEWESVKQSTAEEVKYYWMPGTKVVGALDFGGNQFHGDENAHGTGTTSVSVGNIHGTCPSCLLVFLSYSGAAAGEAAIEWAMSQPWIDAISNSYGFSLAYRDRFYSGSNTKLQKKASERGQTIFFSAGNGQANAFLVPNTTLLSSQEGPDWIVTVGAVSPGAHASYTGHGKPADIASIGSRYPAAYGSPMVGGTGSGGFGGTSNATPVIAGTYANALYQARQDMKGRSRIQSGGVISKGSFRCGGTRACELDDGALTVSELRTRLFEGAVHTEPGMTPAGVGSLPVLADEEFMNEGHGSYFGRETGKDHEREMEFLNRLYWPLTGVAKPPKRPRGEKQWMIVDSYCRQSIWGAWGGGYYRDGKTKLPEPDAAAWPLRTAYQTICPTLQPPP